MISPIIKSVVFKTPKLKDTKEFFSNVLGFVIKESTVKHFVIYSKNIRIVFLESENNFEVELFLNSNSKTTHVSLIDPNNIKVTALNVKDFSTISYIEK